MLPAIVEKSSITQYVESAKKYAAKSRAASTIRAYQSAWKEFAAFAGDGALPATPQTVIAYLTALADSGSKVSTIGVKLAAISFRHQAAKLPDPTQHEDVKLVWSGIRRELGTRPSKKAPVTLDDLRRMVEAIDTGTLAGKRDKAMLLLGWAGAFRRSELVALDVADLHVNGAIKVTLRKSKTDQEGAGQVKIIPPIDDETLDPVQALRRWLDAANIQSGPIFRKVTRWDVMSEARLTSQSVALIVKHLAEHAGLDPRQFSGHSLRSGFITAAATAGVESRDIMAQTGHKSENVMRGYIQDAGRGASAAVRAAFGCPPGQ
jgi:integrase